MKALVHFSGANAPHSSFFSMLSVLKEVWLLKIPASRRQPSEHRRVVDQAPGDEVDDFAFALDDAEDAEQAGAEEFLALAFGEAGMDNDVGNSGFVFQRQKDDAVGAAGALAVGDEAGAAGGGVVARLAQRGGGGVAAPG